MADSLAGRRKRGLTQAKAKKIAHEGLSSAGDGFHSEKQKRYIGWVAGGSQPRRSSKRRKRG